MVKRIAWKAIRPMLKPFVKNPYSEGTLGSLGWKSKWGEPLSEAEKDGLDKLKDAAVEMMGVLRPFMDQMPHWLRAPGGYELLDALVDSLPKPMREFLHNSTPGDAERNIEEMLHIASYQRERTSVRYARCALIMSAMALLLSVLTSAAAIFIQLSQ